MDLPSVSPEDGGPAKRPPFMSQESPLRPETQRYFFGLELRVAILERELKGLNDSLEKINANLSRVVWLIIVAIVGALLSTIITSGIQ